MKESDKVVPIVEASTKFTSEPTENQHIVISKLQTIGYDLLDSEKRYYKKITRL